MVVYQGRSTFEAQVNTTTCSDAGVLSSLLCVSGAECLNFTVSEQCTIDPANEWSLSQTGCVALPPTAAPG